jgi:hypothetical protein
VPLASLARCICAIDAAAYGFALNMAKHFKRRAAKRVPRMRPAA